MKSDAEIVSELVAERAADGAEVVDNDDGDGDEVDEEGAEEPMPSAKEATAALNVVLRYFAGHEGTGSQLEAIEKLDDELKSLRIRSLKQAKLSDFFAPLRAADE